MKLILPLLLLLSRSALADAPHSADAIACFDTLQNADAVVSAGEVDDVKLPHIVSLTSADLVRPGEHFLEPSLVGESAHAYLLRVLARLKLVAPSLVQTIIEANRELKGHVSFEKQSVGPIAELDTPDWDGSSIDKQRCLLVPIIAPAENETSLKLDSDPIARMDQRLFRKSVLPVQSRAALLLRADLNRIAPNLTEHQASTAIQLFFADNPDDTYDSYLKEVGAQGLLPEFPDDGKVWAAPGYELLYETLRTLIGKAYPYLQDDTVSGGKALRIKVEATGRGLNAGFECPRRDIPYTQKNDDDSGGEEGDVDFTLFKACGNTLSALVIAAKPKDPKDIEDVEGEIQEYLKEKSSVAEGRTIQSFLNPPAPEAGQDPVPSLRAELDGFKDFTDDDRAEVDTAIGLLAREIGTAIANDSSLDGGGSLELADPFQILRETRLHYLGAKVPQIDRNP